MVKGGTRKGAGAPFHLLHLDDDTARSLRILALNRLSFSSARMTPQQMAQQIIAEQVAKLYAEYDEEIQQAEEMALLGEQEEQDAARA